jgi:hypothetical protein
LLAAAQSVRARLGYVEAVLWVLPDKTRARRFHEVAGWTTDGTQRTSEVLGVGVLEVRYRRPVLASTVIQQPVRGQRASAVLER